ncbi:MAG: DNA-3-methyladenine glycosylase [Thermomicrobiales bacterium]
MSSGAAWQSSAVRQSVRLDRPFFARPACVVAPDLLGCCLHTGFDATSVSGRIVETEAYAGPADLASHAARLAKGRLVMAGPPGIAYVYRSYGIHAMFNVVCAPNGEHGAVLIRALAPIEGSSSMATRRGGDRVGRDLCSGPGRLCQAMGIFLEHDGTDVIESDLIWLTTGQPPSEIWVSSRIGISRARETPWRFFDPASPCVSAHRRGIAFDAGGSMLGDGVR